MSTRIPKTMSTRRLESCSKTGGFFHPVVRDVAFVLCCPQLVEDSETMRVYDKLPRGRALAQQQEWLDDLDENPRAVHDWLESSGKQRRGDHRLGTYYADIVEFVLRHCPTFGFARILAGIQVHRRGGKEKGSRASTTIGEFDVLLDPGESEQGRTNLEHLEMTVKFLLHVDSYRNGSIPVPPLPCPLSTYLGPHKAENLLDRTLRLQRQLRLSTEPTAMSIIEENFVSTSIDIRKMAHIQGYLFYHVRFWMLYRNEIESLLEPEEGRDLRINRKHWHGWWMHARDASLLAEMCNQSKWYVVPKLRWLSPALLHPHESDVLLGTTELVGRLKRLKECAEQTGKPRQQRFLVAQMDLDEALHGGCWTESSRGFFVEDDWPRG